MNSKKHELINKIYRRESIKKISEEINMLGDSKLNLSLFINVRLITSIIIFFLTLYTTNLGYIYAPLITIIYYYIFYYILIKIPLKRRIKRLDHQALHFFEILTLTLESSRNLEKSLEVTISNVHSELSDEFKRVLFEMKFGKSLIEALEDMKKRIPSETINNIILNITQTDVFGSSILETMYNQIDFLREKQILEIKGEINKIPNKVSIISVVFIVPLILILILGPFLINLLG